MSNVVKLQPKNTAIDEAGDWIAKMDRGLTKDEEHQLKQWFDAHPDNHKALLEMAKVWDDMNVLNKLSMLFPEPPKEQSKFNLIAVAASFVALSVMLGFLVNNMQDWFVGKPDLVVFSEQKLRTGVGESKRVVLSDGSEMLLNTNSNITVTFTNLQRVIQLNQGEFHIQVAKDELKPLTVYAQGQVIQAVGTAFNVQIDNGEVELLVTEGKVRVARQQDIAIDPVRPEVINLTKETTALVQGQRSILSAPQYEVQQVVAEEMKSTLSWQSGNLVFRGNRLEEVLQEVSRYNTITFQLSDSELKDVQVSGLFKTNDVDGFLQALEQNFNIKISRTARDAVMLSRG